ncbi:MAG: hypothetical protein U0359_00975 [Byssovorax sp.]
MKILKKEVGNWVSGDRFWDREEEIPLFIELLRDGAHVLLVAQRRVGKTSLMREVARRLGDEFVCLHIDLQKSHTQADAMVELSLATQPHLGLWAKTKETFKNTLSSVESLGIDELTIKLRDGLSADWQAKGERLLDGVASSEKPVVVFMDELPILVNRLLKGTERAMTPERVRQADAFVSFLRAQSIKHKGKIRFVIAGSIGLQPVLRQAGLSATVNTFTPFELHPWDAYAAIGCIEALARGHNLDLAAGVPQKMVALLGSCVPHHVQMFFTHVYSDCRRGGSLACSIDDIMRVYQTSMLSNRGHAEMNHLEERLAMVLSDEDLPLALDLLTEAAVTGHLSAEAAKILAADYEPDRPARIGFVPPGGNAPSARGDALASIREILDIFEHDGYLTKEGDRYVFVSNLVKDWWKARFGFGFVAAAKRRVKL